MPVTGAAVVVKPAGSIIVGTAATFQAVFSEFALLIPVLRSTVLPHLSVNVATVVSPLAKTYLIPGFQPPVMAAFHTVASVADFVHVDVGLGDVTAVEVKLISCTGKNSPEPDVHTSSEVFTHTFVLAAASA